MGGVYVGRKEETRLKSNGRKSEWKTPSMEGEGKGDRHQYGRKPRTPEPIPIAGNSLSEEEMGHWTPTGIEPKVYDDDESFHHPQVIRHDQLCTVLLSFLCVYV